MIKSMKLDLKRSELREKLLNAPEDEQEAIQKELTDCEKQYREALIAEEEEAKRAKFPEGDDAQSRELIQLQERAQLRNYFASVLGGVAPTGAESELNQALGLAGNGMNGGVQIPHSLLGNHERADASTDSSALTGAIGQSMIIPRIWPMAVTASMNVERVSVPAGESEFVLLKSGTDASFPGEGTAIDSVAATFETTKLTPKRLSARYKFSVELSAQKAEVESALRSDLAMTISDSIEKQILVGSGSTGFSGFFTNIARPARGSAAFGFGNFLSLSSEAVDGLYSSDENQNGIICDIETYRKMGSLVNSQTDASALEVLRGRSRLLMTSVHIPTPPESGGSSGRQGEGSVLIARGTAMGRRSAIVAVWPAVELVRDPYSAAASGEVSLTAISLLDGVCPFRADAFQRVSPLVVSG